MVPPVQPRNVLFIHAMGMWDNVTNLFVLSNDKIVHDMKQTFSPDAHLLAIRGADLRGDHMTQNAVMRGIKEHVAKHGVIDELVINAHGLEGSIYRLGATERFLGRLRDLRHEMGAPFAKRIVFASCEGFKFMHNADERVRTVQNLARELDAELVGATTSVFTPAIRISDGQGWYGRFIKFAPDGSITRDVLDVTPEAIRAQVERSRPLAKSTWQSIKFPSREASRAARELPGHTERIRTWGWDVEAMAHRGIVKKGESIAREISDEALWVAKHLNTKPFTHELPLAGESLTNAATHAGSSRVGWGTVALVGGAVAVVGAWLASSGRKPKDEHRYRLPPYVPPNGPYAGPVVLGPSQFQRG